MSLISPDAIFSALARMVGVEPAKLANMINSFTARFAAWDAEIVAFKQGAGLMVAKFDARLGVLEDGQRRMEAQLTELLTLAGAQQPDKPRNGKVLSNERNNAE